MSASQIPGNRPLRRAVTETMSPRAQLAWDEALLLDAERGGEEVLRTWEFEATTVVLGRSSKVDFEVDRDYCRRQGIPVLRRCSGGAAVVGGSGCLMYSLVVALDRQRELQKIDVAHRFVMGRVQAAVARQLPEVSLQGTCDLTWRGQKCSGNSLKVGRQHLLYHGTILYDADLDQIARCLAEAPRQPEYRAGRSHRQFVVNIPIDPNQFSSDLGQEFGVEPGNEVTPPRSRIRDLLRDRYDDDAWHFRH